MVSHSLSLIPMIVMVLLHFLIRELGFEQIEEGKAYCLPCTPGKFGDGDGCTTCTKGTYQPNMKQATCLDCEKGKVSSNDGASNVQ